LLGRFDHHSAQPIERKYIGHFLLQARFVGINDADGEFLWPHFCNSGFNGDAGSLSNGLPEPSFERFGRCLYGLPRSDPGKRWGDGNSDCHEDLYFLRA
jgi:hypothetical protein